ncbi:MAG: transposase [Burkholderiales bacterium]|nr:transposase [Burkholderiales bacterium]
MEQEKFSARRNYSAQFRTLVLEQCAAPGASVAKVALSHGMNANVVHRWRQEARDSASSVGVRGLYRCLCPRLPTQPTKTAQTSESSCAEGARPWPSLGPVRRQMSARPGCESCCDDPHRLLVAGRGAHGHACRKRAAACPCCAGVWLGPGPPRLPVRQRACHTHQVAGA